MEVSVCSLPLWGSWDTLRHRLGIALVGLSEEARLGEGEEKID